MAWIRLHLRYKGRVVYVNTKNINHIYNDHSIEKEEAFITFSGNDDNYIKVTESVEEIMSQIKTNESISMDVSAL